jgi:hypothetical protein
VAARSRAPPDPGAFRCWRRTNGMCIRSDTDRRREQEDRAGPCRRSSVARRSRCRCKRVSRTPPLHPCHPCRLRIRRVRFRLPSRRVRPCRSYRHDRRCLRRRTRRPIQTRRLRRPAADRRRRDSRRHSRRRCRARSPDTRPDSVRSHRYRHRRSVRPRIPPRPRRLHVRHLRLFRQLRRHSIHRRRPGQVWLSIRTLRPPATIEDRRSTSSSSRAPGQHHACHSGCGAYFPRARTDAQAISGRFVAVPQETDELAEADRPSPVHSAPDNTSRRVARGRRRWSRSCVRNGDGASRICVNVCFYSSD